MPNIDVSELIGDPDFSTTIGVVRSFEELDEHGRNVIKETYEDDVVAVVIAGGGQALALLPDGARISDSIVVYCQKPLQAATESTRGDIVVWNGSRYLVKISKDWSAWGAGFYNATCEFLGKANP
jgi:hypothetical protein